MNSREVKSHLKKTYHQILLAVIKSMNKQRDYQPHSIFQGFGST